MRQRFFVVENPGAGVSGSPLVEEVVRLLAKSGGSVTRARSADVPAARLAVRKAAEGGDYDAIIAAGGDGTIRQAAAALIGSDMPLGIIPVGTGNVLAHEIGLARTPAAISSMLLQGPVAKVAWAEANGEPFLLMVGVLLSASRERSPALASRLAVPPPPAAAGPSSARSTR
jgi:diacylglycerol kinase family enzyme